MRKKILLVLFSIGAGIIFTYFILNNEKFYAKEEYLVYAFQVGAYEKHENSLEFAKGLPSSIIVPENNLNKIYVAIYKDVDIVNKMIVYFENNDINIYLKSLKASKKFYNNLANYEQIIANSEDVSVYNKVNQSILNLYLEDINDYE